MCGVKIFVIMTLVVSLTLATRMDPDRDVRKESERRRKDGKISNKDEVRSNDIKVNKHLGERDLRRQPFRKVNLMRTIDGALRNDFEAKNEWSAAECAYHSVNEANETPSKGKRVKNEDEVKRQEEEVEYTENGCPTATDKWASHECYKGFRYGCDLRKGELGYKKCWSTKLSGENLGKHKAIWDYWATNTTKEKIKCETAADCLRYWKEQEEVAEKVETRYRDWFWRQRERNHTWHPCFNDWTYAPCFRGHRFGCWLKINPAIGLNYKHHCWVQTFLENDVDMCPLCYGYQVFYNLNCDTNTDCGNYLRQWGRPTWIKE